MAKKKTRTKRQNIPNKKQPARKAPKGSKKPKKVVKSRKKPVSKKKKKVTSSKTVKSKKKVSSKKGEKPAGKSSKKKISKKKKSRGSSRYRTIQRILSDYCKANDIKLGKGFNKAVSELYRRTQGQPLKFIEQNIDILFQDYIGKPTTVQKFPDNFPFYQFMDTIAMPIFDRVQIGVVFQDSMEQISYEGLAFDVQSWYSMNLHPYLRQNYNSSPVAYFMIIDTDNQTYVRYQVVISKTETAPPISTQPEKPVVKPAQKEEPTPPKEEKPAVEKEVELEREKQKSTDKEIELQKEKQKTIELQLQANAERLKQIRELREMGFTNDEIKGMLN